MQAVFHDAPTTTTTGVTHAEPTPYRALAWTSGISARPISWVTLGGQAHVTPSIPPKSLSTAVNHDSPGVAYKPSAASIPIAVLVGAVMSGVVLGLMMAMLAMAWRKKVKKRAGLGADECKVRVAVKETSREMEEGEEVKVPLLVEVE